MTIDQFETKLEALLIQIIEAGASVTDIESSVAHVLQNSDWINYGPEED